MTNSTTCPSNGQRASVPQISSVQANGPDTPRVALRIGSAPTLTFDAEQIVENLVGQLIQQVETTTSPVRMKIQNLPDWPGANRWLLFQLIRVIGKHCRIWMGTVDN